EDALRVYEALLGQRAGDGRLRSRVESLTPGGRKHARADAGRGGGENVQAFLRRILAARPGEAAAASTDARPSGGRSPLERAFAVVPPEVETDPGDAAPGEATRPASEGISRDRVCGDEGPRRWIRAPPATPQFAADPTPLPAAPSGGFSFDQFFSPA